VNDHAGRTTPKCPKRLEPGPPRRRFTRGRAEPRGVVWFGVRSFWGHLRHFIASAIATEDVDSRDWMSADDPRALAVRVAGELGGSADGFTVTERLERDLWIDYVADTGDDVSVSGAVARLVCEPYELPDPERSDATLVAPRGDVLLFGGDTAYPVATADEITDRVIVPFNQALEARRDGRRRVLLGIPGNHDWYDGLDGFGRMFRRPVGDEERAPPTTATTKTLIDRYTDFALEFVRGGQIEKPKTLDLVDYRPAQSASYFALPVAPNLVIVAVDRQLKTIDRRQAQYFRTWLGKHPGMTPWVVLPDPVFRFGREGVTGPGMIQSLGLNLGARRHFVLSGDIHHYCREQDGPTLHVTAGGGGAFLHPAPIARSGVRPSAVEWPGGRQSRALLRQVPWKVALGRSGFLPHLALLAMFLPTLHMGLRAYARIGVLVTAPIAITIVSGIGYALIGGIRHGRRVVGVLALVAALVTAALPVVASIGARAALIAARVTPNAWLVAAIALFVGVFAGAFVFGAYLAVLTALGLENTQAFTALDHPGFKHFLRLRVRADGSRVDGWCVGLTDPLAADAEPVLVDAFTWKRE
jgi:hypothetical protein